MTERQREKIDRGRLVVSLVGVVLMFALCIFVPAGTRAWPRGWLFILMYAALLVIASFYIWRVNPDLFAARINAHEGTKTWDKFLLAALLFFFLATFVVAGLDDGRFHWWPIPWSVCMGGYLLLFIGVGLITWAESVNKFFEPTVRIQADRGQRVVDTGPYAFVRHPGYVSCLPMGVGIALALGSLWAVVPALLSCAVLILRTQWEDRTLQAELAGYKEYAQRVRYKWIPGVW